MPSKKEETMIATGKERRGKPGHAGRTVLLGAAVAMLTDITMQRGA
jgi:hypothetical protein